MATKQPAKIIESVYEGWTCLTCVGDISEQSGLAQMLEQFLRESASTHVIVDMTRATFIDSTGLRALMTGHKRLAPLGEPLRVVVTSSQILRIIGIVGFDAVLRIFPTLQEAASPDAS